MTDEGTSLITDDARAWIGRVHRFGPEPVIARDVRRYLAATQAWPEKGDLSADEIAVPPMFYRTLGRWVGPVNGVGDDGLWGSLRPPIGQGQTLAGGIEMTFLRPLVVGDVITGERQLVSLEEKAGRRRRFVLAVWQAVLRDAAGHEVVRERTSEIMY